MATDFRSGRDFPRRGREELDGFLWLARVSDKGRASAAGTIYDYIYPCPMDRGVFERWGITAKQFDEALRSTASDDELLTWAREHIPDDRRERANRWLLEEKSGSMDRQDREEGVIAA